jgi:hypothetical protein
MEDSIVKVEKIEELAIRLPEDFAETGEKVHGEIVETDGECLELRNKPTEGNKIRGHYYPTQKNAKGNNRFS